MLTVGTKAPEFALPDQNGTIHTLEQYKGKKVILYFYPKDNTTGCTRQACGFAERNPQFYAKGAVVLGISKDSVASHQKFAQKYSLPFAILSDTELEENGGQDLHGRGAHHLSDRRERHHRPGGRQSQGRGKPGEDAERRAAVVRAGGNRAARRFYEVLKPCFLKNPSINQAFFRKKPDF